MCVWWQTMMLWLLVQLLLRDAAWPGALAVFLLQWSCKAEQIVLTAVP
jgi:hypothetical protein